jgi:mannose-1-phosphate guanylyltransferase
MFMFKAAIVLEELKKYVPDILAACEASFLKGKKDQGFFYLDKPSFEQCPSDSIDYAIMENTDRGVMVSFNAGWDDLGSWEALWNVGAKDDSGNVTNGDVICVDAENTLVNARNRLVTVLGVKDLAVVETQDAVLVTSLNNTQGVKKIVGLLNAENRRETKSHCKNYTSWGTIEAVDEGENFQVRKITVSPGLSFSLKGHSCRSVQWVILDGTARLTLGDDITILSKNLSITIEPGISIRLDNNDKHPLIFLEVIFGNMGKTDHFDSYA